MKVQLRSVTLSDAQEFARLFVKLAGETRFTVLTQQEAITAAEKQAQRLEQLLQSDHQMVFVAECEGDLVGYIGLTQGLFEKNRHAATLSMGVCKQFWGHGVGNRLMRKALAWCAQRSITRLELTVIENNHRAIAFYHRFGFEKEGFRIASLVEDGKPVNEIAMVKFLD